MTSSFAPLSQALPMYSHHTNTAGGCGTGFLIGWQCSLQHLATKPCIEYDTSHLLSFIVRRHTLTFMLLA